jgi:ABC-type Fe3+ transport system permease subunit
LLAPTLVTTFLLVFLSAATTLTLPLFLRSAENGTLAIVIFYQWGVGHSTVATVLSVLVLTATIALTVLMRYLGNRLSVHIA